MKYGSSSSGTPGTLIAEVIAAPGQQLVSPVVIARGNEGAASQAKLIVSYDSGSPLELTIANVVAVRLVRWFGLMYLDNDGLIVPFGDGARRITGIRLETLATGTQPRSGTVVCTEVPI